MIDDRAARVAFFLSDFPVGGVERVTANLMSGMATRGWNVDLVLADGRAPAHSVPAGVRVVDLGRSRTASAVMPLARYLRRARPRALVAAKDHANVVACVSSALARTRTPVVAVVHSLPSETLARPERWTGHVVRRLLRSTYTRVARVVAISDGIAADIRTVVPAIDGRLVVIPNPIVDEHLQGACGVSDGSDVIMWCGRFTQEKDPMHALEAFARVRTRRGASLVMCGDGLQRSAVEARCRELELSAHVTFPGLVDDIPERLGRAAVLVLSSRREGVPTVVIEALAVGTQVVATDCGPGPRTLLADGAYGRLVPVGDTAAMACALENALDDPLPGPPRDHLEMFGVDRAVRGYLALLDELDGSA